jgi:chorismate--pyruvate lyase
MPHWKPLRRWPSPSMAAHGWPLTPVRPPAHQAAAIGAHEGGALGPAPCAQAWLSWPGSLSAALESSFGGFRVEVVFQGPRPCRGDEAACLGLPRPARVQVREVVLWCGERAVVMARSLTQREHLRGPWRALKGLGSRPLAELLFHHEAVARSPLEVARLAPHSPECRRWAQRWLGRTGEPLLTDKGAVMARRRVFRRQGAPLLVMELFHPEVLRSPPRRPPSNPGKPRTDRAIKTTPRR